MEAEWLKTEPVDDSFDDCFSVKLEQAIAEPLTIIEEDVSGSVCITNDASEEIEVNPILKFDVKKGAKKTRKRQEKGTPVKSDDEKVKKESGVKKPKHNRKASPRVKKSYICDECGREFTGGYNLNRHKLTHSGLRPYICPEENCGAAFGEKYLLKSHQMLHTGGKFCCEECGKGFQSKFYMQIHQQSKHSGERSFVCGECGQGFTRKNRLTIHQLEHSGEKPHECEDCGMRFYELILLKSHRKTHTAGGKQYTCAECGKGFYHKTSLNAHQRNHSTVRPFACEICGKRFIQKGTLNIHKVIHSDVRPFGCEECGMRFTQKITLKTHRMKQHGLQTTFPKQQKSIPVPVVAEPTIVRHNDNMLRNGYDNSQPSETSESNATVSMDSSHKSIFPSNTTDSSKLKEGAFATESRSQSQQREEGSEVGQSALSSKTEPISSENECMTNGDESVFEYKFAPQPQRIKEEPLTNEASFDIWKSEQTTSHDEYLDVSERPIKMQFAPKNSSDESVKLPFACDKCERTFALVSALRNHQRVHKSNKKKPQNFVCDECGKVVSSKQHLKIHMRIHSGSTPYHCTVCDKSFTQVGNLKSHQQIHTGERPFACETCGMRFSMKNTLDKHKLTHTEDRNFACDICGMKFKQPSSIKRHKLRHTGEKSYGCDICGKTYYDKSYIKFHLRTHTGEKPFACDQCPSSFIDKSQLRQHKGYCHRVNGEPSPYRRRKLMKMMNNSL